MADGLITNARIALGAVAPVPLLASRAAAGLEGQAPTAAAFARVAAVSAEEALPITDLRGTDAFRRELVAVLTRRALEEALARAGRAA
jgi:carbon-monoxide dehydrogenase medium subunit